MALGNVGKSIDLTVYDKIFNGVFQLIYDASEPRDDVRVYAAKAFGGIASSNINKSLPLITSQIANKNEGYLMLYTLKEVIQNIR